MGHSNKKYILIGMITHMYSSMNQYSFSLLSYSFLSHMQDTLALWLSILLCVLNRAYNDCSYGHVKQVVMQHTLSAHPHGFPASVKFSICSTPLMLK